MAFTRIVDHSIYPRRAVSEARAAYKDFCSVSVVPMADNKVTLTIMVLPAHSNNERDVICSFMNFALDKALEAQLASI